MKPIEKNSNDAKALSLDLQQKEEIDTKLGYYKSVLKAHADLCSAIDAKIAILEKSGGGIFSGIEKSEEFIKYEIAKLRIEKCEAENTINEKKQFFEMWLGRSVEYDKTFAILTEECNRNFAQVEAEAQKLAEGNIKLRSFITKYGLEKEENKTQKMKNEYFLLLKYEITKITGKGKFIESKN